MTNHHVTLLVYHNVPVNYKELHQKTRRGVLVDYLQLSFSVQAAITALYARGVCRGWGGGDGSVRTPHSAEI